MAAIYQTGIDVSRYQGTIDWAAMARAGKQFAVIRAVSSNNSGVYVAVSYTHLTLPTIA